ncbi:hypothetical protein [Morganella morganii]|nr:hypothetical protein [Morganella morganii]
MKARCVCPLLSSQDYGIVTEDKLILTREFKREVSGEGRRTTQRK